MDNMNNYNTDNTNNMNGYNNQIQGSTPGFAKYLTFSILEILCCSWIPGVIALVFIILFNTAYRRNDMAEYESKKKAAKITLWIGLIVGIVINVIIGVLYGVSIAAAIFN